MRKLLFTAFLTCGLGAQVQAQDVTFSQAYQAYQQAQQQGDYKQALQHAKQALILGKEKFGQEHKNTLALQYNLANTQAQNKKFQQAYQAQTDLLPAYQQRYGKISNEYYHLALDRMLNAAKTFKVLRKTKNMDKIDELRSELELIQQDNHALALALAADSRFNAGLVYHQFLTTLSLGKRSFLPVKDLLAMAQQAEKQLLKDFGEADTRLLDVRYRKATLLQGLKQTDAAVQSFEQVIKSLDGHLASSHPYELAAHARLVKLYESQGKSAQATKHCVAIGAMTPWREDQKPVPLYRQEPKYPVSAARHKQEGEVYMLFDLDEQGVVQNVRVFKRTGPLGFATEATKALKKWRYAPKFVDGKATMVKNLRVRLDFYLNS